jgi:putative ABC transport system permease protein
MFDDIRHTFRLMRRQKAFTAAVLVTFAVGIGANTAIFSMVYGVLLRPLPYATADRLVRVSEVHPGGVAVIRNPMLSNWTYYAWTPKTLDALAAYGSEELTLERNGQGERVTGANASPVLFSMLGAQPALGRVLRGEDAAPGAPPTVVLSHTLWRDRFGADALLVGQTIRLGDIARTVVGVMAEDFYFPDRQARFWIPHRVPRPGEIPSRAFGGFYAVGLLKPGATVEQVAAEGTLAALSAGRRPPAADLVLGKGGPVEVRARPLADELTHRVRPALVVLLASASLVLLIACANVTNLVLSRGVTRRRELAVRVALGGSSARVARQLITETLVLAAIGGVLGVALGFALTRAVPLLAPRDFPRLADIHVDGVALAFSSVVSIVAGLLAGLVPALRVARGDLLVDLREGTRTSAGKHTRRIGAGLLVAETAVALVLLVGAGLLGRSFVRLLAVDPGYNTAGVVLARIHLPGGSDGRRNLHAASAVLDRVRTLPGVHAAGVGSMAPLTSMSAVIMVMMRGDSAEPLTARARSYVVTPQYAEALSMRVVEGRLFNEGDAASATRPILVNEEFVRSHLNDGRPAVGRRFVNELWGEAPVEIVGVVGNVLKDGLDTSPQAEMYNLPRAPFAFHTVLNLIVRATADPVSLAAALRQAVRETLPSAAMGELEPLDSRVAASVSQPRFAMLVFVAFAAVAMLLAAIGLYGVLSHQVLQRRAEMGVRAALGATPRALVALVMREGLLVTTAGIVLGLAGAAWLSRLLQSLLFGVTPHDAAAFVAAPLALLVVAVLATVIPARRAAATDPIDALRHE